MGKFELLASWTNFFPFFFPHRFNKRSTLSSHLSRTTPRLARDVHCSSWNSPRDLLVSLRACSYHGCWVGKNVNCGPDNGLGSRSSWTSIRPRKGCIKYRYRSIDDKSRAGFEELLFSFSFPFRLDGVRSSRLLFISVYFSLQPFLSRLINKTMDDCRPIYKSPRYFLHLPDSK